MNDNEREPEVLNSAGGERPPVIEDQRLSHRRRDAEALSIIGAFLSILAALVLVGVIMHRDGAGMKVGVVAGILLLVIGFVTVGIGLRLKRSPG